MCENNLQKLLTLIGDSCKIHFVVKQCTRVRNAQIAQLVEQRTENPRVTGSIPVLGIPRTNKYAGVVQW